MAVNEYKQDVTDKKMGPYTEYAVAQEKAMTLTRDEKNKAIQIINQSGTWWIYFSYLNL